MWGLFEYFFVQDNICIIKNIYSYDFGLVLRKLINFFDKIKEKMKRFFEYECGNNSKYGYLDLL